MKVWEVLAKKSGGPSTVNRAGSVAEAIAVLVDAHVRGLPVMDGPKLVGMITTRDVLRRLRDRGADALRDTVGDVMTRPVVSVDHDAPLDDVESVFGEKGISHIPVVESGKLVGVLTPADVFGSHLDDERWVNAHLRDYLYGGSFR